MISNEEICKRFDVLYNNITSFQAPGLDTYEKSVFWNKAQLEVLKNHLNPKGNKYGEGFDHSSKRQIDFSSLTEILVYTFSSEDIIGSYNVKAFRYKGIEETETKTVTQWYIDAEGKVRTRSVEVSSSDINDKHWPDDILSIINESLDVLSVNDWNKFIFYTTKFINFPFITDSTSIDSVVVDFADWSFYVR